MKMMAPEPLRSAMTSGGAEDTSLALPSDRQLRSGQQRVLDQVHTIKRSKSKQSKNGTLSPSPTSMSPTTLANEFGSFKFLPSKANGSVKRMGSTMTTSQSKSTSMRKSRTLSTKGSSSKQVSNSGIWESDFTNSNGSNGLKPSRSDPALAASSLLMKARGQTVQSHQSIQQSSQQSFQQSVKQTSTQQSFQQSKQQTIQQSNQQSFQQSNQQTIQQSNQQSFQSRANRQSIQSIANGSQMTNSQTRMIRPPSSQSQTEGKMGTIKMSKSEQQSAVNSAVAVNMSDLTLREAVEYLAHADENYQQCGATFIQHTTFKEDGAKQEVLDLGGMPSLVTLLQSSNPGVSQAAAGALRNLVFRHLQNKLEVQHCSGVAKSLQLLKETDSTETQKQITGLLWNLSSADELKAELRDTALPALTENVVVPFTCWSDNSANNNIHPDVFYNATGCLRNLSCGQKKEREAMRDCRGLIDSLMGYVNSCVSEENPDDKSVENCICILHNLTYQLEKESPECFSEFLPKTEEDPGNKKSPTIGCFSPKSSKAQKKFAFDMSQSMPEDQAPTGVKWLCHRSAMQTYLSLLSTSQKDATLEAACGALQNLTANKGTGSTAMSHILVQKLAALAHLTPLLKSPNHSLQKSAMSLLGNMSRSSSLQTTLAKQMLPVLTSLLTAGPQEMGNSDETVATACNTARTLMTAGTDVTKKVLSNELVTSLADLSENGSYAKGSKAASLLLYSLWNEKNLHSTLKKMGFDKTVFVNDNTTAVHRSMQVIE